MPTYVYTSDDGERVERTQPLGKHLPEKITKQGKTFYRDYQAESCKVPPPSNWPLVSEAAAVHPDQVQEANQGAKQAGLSTYYLKDGRAVFPDRNARKQFLKHMQWHDKQGGYGD